MKRADVIDDIRLLPVWSGATVDRLVHHAHLVITAGKGVTPLDQRHPNGAALMATTAQFRVCLRSDSHGRRHPPTG